MPWINQKRWEAIVGKLCTLESLTHAHERTIEGLWKEVHDTDDRLHALTRHLDVRFERVGAAPANWQVCTDAAPLGGFYFVGSGGGGGDTQADYIKPAPKRKARR